MGSFCSCLSAGYCCSLDRAVLILTGQLLGLGRFHAMSLCCPYCSLFLSLQRLKNFLGCFTKFCSQCRLCSLVVSLEVFLMCKRICTLSICWQSTLCLCWWSHTFLVVFAPLTFYTAGPSWIFFQERPHTLSACPLLWPH